jgi:lipoprotein NlpI
MVFIGRVIRGALDLIKATEIDKVKYKSQIVEASGYLANYFANVKSDYESSIKWFDKILEVDPTNADAIKYKDILSKRISSKK